MIPLGREIIARPRKAVRARTQRKKNSPPIPEGVSGLAVI